MDARCRIELFGGLRVRQGERVITRFRTQKTASLLAYLAYFLTRTHPREVLIELLWPENLPKAGRQSLSMALSSLRHQLEPPDIPSGTIIQADRLKLCLEPAAVTTDVSEFEALTQAGMQAAGEEERISLLAAAADLYQGELLHGHYENWICPEQEHCKDAYLSLLRQLIRSLAQTHQYERALDYTHRALHAEPLHEEFYRNLMRLYAVLKRPVAALEQYEELKRLLSEIGAVPSVMTRELAESLPLSTLPRGIWPPDTKPSRHRDAGKDAACKTVGVEAESFRSVGAVQPLTPYLPLQLARFFGREEEIVRLQQSLGAREQPVPTTRLVTLTGPGGAGKTRLAIETAGRLVEVFGGAVWFVSLANLRDPHRIPSAIADALRLPRSSRTEPLEQVVEFLNNLDTTASSPGSLLTPSRLPSLLVLDNCEQFAVQIAPYVRTLLERVPMLTCLATSRRRLGLRGESELAVPPLHTPILEPGKPRDTERRRIGDRGSGREADSTPTYVCRLTPEQLLEVASVQLFVDRAQAVRPDFQLTDRNATDVAALCVSLEGIPLAIELAASRALLLSPSQMLARLTARFEMLTNRRAEKGSRHRSLWAAIEWSYHLLAPQLQRLFARLSVFRGGWTAQAVEAVCFPLTQDWEQGAGSEGLALEFMTLLRECSLIVPEDRGVEVRFQILETLRQFAQEQLTEGEQAELSRRHADYFLKWAEVAEPEITGPNQSEWLACLETEHDNFRTALEWSLSEKEESGSATPERREGRKEERTASDSSFGLRLVGMLSPFWSVRGYFDEARRWLERALSHVQATDRTPERATALSWAGSLADAQGDYVAAATFHEQSLAIRRELGDRRGVATALGNLGNIALDQGDFDAARTHFETILALQRELQDYGGIVRSLYNLGRVAYAQGDYVATRAYYEESLALSRDLGDQVMTGFCLKSLGMAADDQGDYSAAHAYYEEGLALFRELEHKLGISSSLIGLGDLALGRGDYAVAYSLYEESQAIQQELGDKYSLAITLNKLGGLMREQGDYGAAQSYCERSLAIRREIGDKPGIPYPLVNLAYVMEVRGDYATARAFLTESLLIRQELKDWGGVPESLLGFAGLAAVQGQSDRAIRLFGAADALREGIGLSLSPAEQAHQDRQISLVRDFLGETAFMAAYEAGRTMPREEAAAYALAGTLPLAENR